MRKGIKSFLKYSISLAIALLLFWYLYKDIKFNDMIARFRLANLSWVYLSIALALLSHWIRAYRWNMLLKPLGYDLRTSRTFWAVMVGYLANFVLPRMGEVSRCAILHKTDEVPISKGFGSVVTERIIDFLCLLLIVGFTFLLEFGRLSDFFKILIEEKTAGLENNYLTLLLIGITILISFILVFFLLKRNHQKLKQNLFYNKVISFLRQLVEGITSVKYLEKPYKFWLSTFAIWILYYFMTYVVIFSLEETSSLSISAGFTMLVLGGIGMATPVQGGIGAFHYLMSAGLLLYGIPSEDGIFFAFLLHTTNSIAIMAVGIISFFISMVIPKRNANIADVNS